MTIEEAKMYLQNGDLAKVATENGFNKSYLYQVFQGKRNNLDITSAIINKAKERREQILEMAK